MDEFDLEKAHLEYISGGLGEYFYLVRKSVFLQLEANEPGCQSGRVHRAVEFPHHIGHGADVVLVSVGEDNAAHAVFVFDQITDVGDDDIDPVHILIRKSHAAVNDEYILSIFIEIHILADLIETAKRHDFQFLCHIIVSVNSLLVMYFSIISDPKVPGRIISRFAENYCHFFRFPRRRRKNGFGLYISLRPSSARIRVASSVNSRLDPTGTP